MNKPPNLAHFLFISIQLLIYKDTPPHQLVDFLPSTYRELIFAMEFHLSADILCRDRICMTTPIQHKFAEYKTKQKWPIAGIPKAGKRQ